MGGACEYCGLSLVELGFIGGAGIKSILNITYNSEYCAQIAERKVNIYAKSRNPKIYMYWHIYLRVLRWAITEWHSFCQVLEHL